MAVTVLGINVFAQPDQIFDWEDLHRRIIAELPRFPGMPTWWATAMTVANSYVRLTEKGDEQQMPGILVALRSSATLDMAQPTVKKVKDAVKKFFDDEIRLRITEQYACICKCKL